MKGHADFAMSCDVKRLNWGCGAGIHEGWINSDRKSGPGVMACDIRDGLPLDNESVDYAVSIHALPELGYDDLVPALRELWRVLKPGGVLRLGLPDLEKGIEAYRRGDRNYFHVPDSDMQTLGGKLITQLVWYGFTKTIFVREFAHEILRKAGFREIYQVTFKETVSTYPEIITLDDREEETFFVEAVK